MRIGIVCPYSWDVPGGVQFHIRDLAEYFVRQGHEVSVLAPDPEAEGLALEQEEEEQTIRYPHG